MSNRWGYANTDHRWLQVEDEPCGRYNLHDCYWAARLVGPLLRDADELGNLTWWEQHGEPFQYSVLAMADRGLLLDHEALRLFTKKTAEEVETTDNRIRQTADESGFSYTNTFPNSKDQQSAFLFQHLGLPGSKKTPSGKRYAVDQDVLNRTLKNLRVRDEPHRRLLWDLFHRIRLNTILTRYLNLTADEDGRVRPIIKMSHVKTWRLAYAKPALQQFPDEARHIIVAADGKVFLSPDYAQLEARELAYYSDDLPSIEVFEAGEDIHTNNARDLFNLTEAEVQARMGRDEWEPYRTYAKSGFLYKMVYGGSAGSGDKKLFCPCPVCAALQPSTVLLNTAESVRAEQRWHARHPRVRRWQAELFEEVRRTHRLPLLLGGYRYISAPPSRDLEREVKNIPMQTGGARLMIRAQNRLHALGAPIVLQHHDSFLLEVPEDEVPLWVPRVRAAMEEPVTFPSGREVVLPCDFKVGKNWGRYHKDRNPNGLRKLAA